MSPFERLFRPMTNPVFIVLYFGLIIALIWKFDQPISTYLYHLDLRINVPGLNHYTKIGLGGLYYPIFLGLALYFRYIRKNKIWEARFWFLLLCLIIPAIITLALKISFGRARPDLFLQSSEHLYGFFGFKWKAIFWSFPSGHTTTIMSVVLGLSILFPRYFLVLMLLGLSIALSRVLLTHHYLSDVLFSIYIVVITIGCLVSVLKSKSWLTPALKHTI